MKLKTIIGVLIIICSVDLYAQNRLTTSMVDSLSYAQYINGDWDNLITLSNRAIKQGIDYYYLRMRVGYAYYMKQNYRKAIVQYHKALQENPIDTYALSQLLYAYQFSGRKYDAYTLSSKIDSLQSPELYNDFVPGIRSIGLFYTYNNGNNGDIADQIRNNIPTNENGIQKLTNNFSVNTFYLSHNIGRRLQVNHSLSYLKKNEHSFVVLNNNLYESANQVLNQWNYNLQMQINLAKGIIITPVYHYLRLKIPVKASGIDDYKDASSLYGMLFNADICNINAGMSYLQGEMNSTDQKQYGVHLRYYPMGNLNLYYFFNGYFQQQHRAEMSTTNFIHQHTLGFKISNYWWTELSYMAPNLTDFYDPISGGVWNSLEGTKNTVNLKHVFFIKNSKLSLILNTGMYQSVSEFVPDEFYFNRFNSHTYSNINFTGGLLWNL